MKDKERSIYNQIIAICQKHNAAKVVLFGSRARKENSPKSDIDLAVYGCTDFRELYFDLNENVRTLLEFDLVDMDRAGLSESLISEIKKDGVILYEKI